MKTITVSILGMAIVIYFREAIEKTAIMLYFSEKTKLLAIVGLCVLLLSLIFYKIAQKAHKKNPYDLNAIRDFSNFFVIVSLIAFVFCFLIPIFV